MIKLLENRISYMIYSISIDDNLLYDFQKLRHRDREEYFIEMLCSVIDGAMKEGLILKTITFFEGSYIVVVAHK